MTDSTRILFLVHVCPALTRSRPRYACSPCPTFEHGRTEDRTELETIFLEGEVRQVKRVVFNEPVARDLPAENVADEAANNPDKKRTKSVERICGSRNQWRHQISTKPELCGGPGVSCLSQGLSPRSTSCLDVLGGGGWEGAMKVTSLVSCEARYVNKLKEHKEESFAEPLVGMC